MRNILENVTSRTGDDLGLSVDKISHEAIAGISAGRRGGGEAAGAVIIGGRGRVLGVEALELDTGNGSGARDGGIHGI